MYTMDVIYNNCCVYVYILSQYVSPLRVLYSCEHHKAPERTFIYFNHLQCLSRSWVDVGLGSVWYFYAANLFNNHDNRGRHSAHHALITYMYNYHTLLPNMYHDTRGRHSAHHTKLRNMYLKEIGTLLTTPGYLTCSMITEVGNMLSTSCYLTCTLIEMGSLLTTRCYTTCVTC